MKDERGTKSHRSPEVEIGRKVHRTHGGAAGIITRNGDAEDMLSACEGWKGTHGWAGGRGGIEAHGLYITLKRETTWGPYHTDGKQQDRTTLLRLSSVT